MPTYEQNKKAIYNWRAKNRDKLNEQARKDSKTYYLKNRERILQRAFERNNEKIFAEAKIASFLPLRGMNPEKKFYLKQELQEFMNILL